MQRKIENRYPLLAYGPGWLPANSSVGPLTLYRTFLVVGLGHGKSWSVTDNGKTPPRPCAFSSMKVFRLNGVTVYWAATIQDQEAWRCINRGGTIVQLQANGSVFGDNTLNTPKRRHDAFVLAKIVAYAKRFH